MKKKSKSSFRIGHRGAEVLATAARKLGLKNPQTFSRIYIVHFCLAKIGSPGGANFQEDFAIIDKWLAEQVESEPERKTKTGGKSSRCSVYALVDPRDGQIRYVGQTRSTLRRRMINHIRAVKRCEQREERMSPCQSWISYCLSLGIKPEIKMLQKRAQWDASEAAWIERLSSQGSRLLNVAARIPKAAAR